MEKKKKLQISFESELWIYQAKVAWHFVSLPEEESMQLKLWNVFTTRGFGSIRVKVRIGKTKWETSVFPSAKRGTYILPIKAAVRKSEKIKAGDVVKVFIDNDV